MIGNEGIVYNGWYRLCGGISRTYSLYSVRRLFSVVLLELY